MEFIKSYVDQAFKQGVIDVIKEAIRRAGGMQWICILYIVSLLFILIYRKHSNDRTKGVVGVYTILAILIIINPLFAYGLIKLNGDGVYWRVFWLLFIQVTIVYAIVEFAYIFKKKCLNGTFIIIGVICILVTGQYIYTEDNFQKVNNYYKIPDLALDIIEHVSQDENDYKALAGPREFQVYTRQIDSSILLTQGRTFSEYHPKSLCGYIESGDIENISKKAISTKTNYIVLENKFVTETYEEETSETSGETIETGDTTEANDGTNNDLTNYGWKKIYSNEMYTLFFGDVL